MTQTGSLAANVQYCRAVFFLNITSEIFSFPRYVYLTSIYARPIVRYWAKHDKDQSSFIFLLSCYFTFNMSFLRDNLKPTILTSY